LAIFCERVDFDPTIIKLKPVVRGLFQPEALTYTCPTSLPHCHTVFNKEMQVRLLCLFHLPGFGCFTRDRMAERVPYGFLCKHQLRKVDC